MKTVIVFYSLEGNTRYAAETLAKSLCADLLELKPHKPYPTGDASKYVAGGFAASIGAKPKLFPYSFSADAYDLIVLGSPVWNSRITPPLNTFLSEHSLAGKKVAAFACHSGGGPEKLFIALEKKVGTLAAKADFVDPAAHPEEAEPKLAQFAETLKKL